MTLPSQSLSRFEKNLSRSLTTRGKNLLASDNLVQAVSELEPLEVYFIVKELGIGTATPILLAASADQLQAFVDLDCWESDQLNLVELDAWLAPFAGLGPHALTAAFLSLDEEIQVVYLKQALVLLVKEDKDDNPSTGRPVPSMTTPDHTFVVEVVDPEADREIEPLELVRALYRFAGPSRAFSVLMQAHGEMVGSLTEQAYQFRSGRLQEMGFPTPEDAKQLFTPPPSEAPGVVPPKLGDSLRHLPAVYASPLEGESLLSIALSRVESQALAEHLESSLMYLVNRAMIAYGEPPRHIDHAKTIAERTTATISLGLECLLSADTPISPESWGGYAEDAERLLHAWPMRDLFRRGFQASIELRRAAHDLISDPVAQNWFTRHENETDDYSQDRRDRAFLRALLAEHPLESGFNPLKPDEVRAFGSKTALEQAAARLNTLAGRLL